MTVATVDTVLTYRWPGLRTAYGRITLTATFRSACIHCPGADGQLVDVPSSAQ
jgi:hypothetical protein